MFVMISFVKLLFSVMRGDSMGVLVYVTSVDEKAPFTFLSGVKKFWTASFTAAGTLVVC